MSWIPDEKTKNELRHYAIQNAIEYNGKANAKSVIGRVLSSRADLRPHARDIQEIIHAEVEAANEHAAQHGLESLIEILEKEAPQFLETREKKEKKTGLTELQHAEKGKVVLRFAPNPNGPLSIGHSRGLVINSQYRDMYDGELILRFDDTDTTIKPALLEAYEQIVEEATWLTGKEPDRIVIASDRIETYYQYAEQMIRENFGYVCQCSGEEFKVFRVSKKECPCRSNTSSKNLELWAMMLNGEFKPGDVVVRVKTDMQLKNPALRDWPALRLQDTTTNPHPRPEIGSKYVVWPLLDFQSAVEDHLQGVTHIIRGKDLMDSTRKQTLLYEHFGWTYPETMYWGRVKIHEWGGFSTSSIRESIENGTYSSWDDVRLPTLSGIKNRGITSEAIRSFWLELGISQKDISVPLSTLFAHNTKAVDFNAPRLSFIRNPMEFQFDSTFEPLVLQNHPNNADLGSKTWTCDSKIIYLESDDVDDTKKLRLKECADIELEDDKLRFLSIERGQEKLPIVHWLPSDLSLEGELQFTKDDEILTIQGRVEQHQLPPGTIVQLERIGYAKVVDETTLFLSYENS